MASLFEHEPCGRCGGRGIYNPSLTYSRCYGCGGRGRRLTKRGEKAQAFYRASLPTKRPIDLVPGDAFRASAADPFVTVVEVGSARVSGSVNGAPTLTVDVLTRPTLTAMGQVTVWGLDPDRPVTVRPDAETLARLRDAALAYQATLTRTGAPRRRVPA